MPKSKRKELRLLTVAALYILKGGVIWGAITFLIGTVITAVVVSHPIPSLAALNHAYAAASIAFVVGSLLYAREVMGITNPARIAFSPSARPRIWMWPFLLCGWSAVIVENPIYLVLGVVAEGMLVARDVTTREAVVHDES